MELLISGVLCLGSVAYFSRLVRRSEGDSNVRNVVAPFKIPDAILAVLLVLFLSANILAAAGTVIVVNADLLIQGAVFSFLLVAGIASFLVIRSINPLTVFGLSLDGWKRSLPAAFIGLIFALPAIYFIHALSFRLLGHPAPQPLMQFLAGNPGWNDRLLLAFTAVVVAPVSEEIVFRGYIYGVSRRYAGRWWALVLSALIFAGIHGHLPSLGGLFVLAVALTLVYEFTASLWAPMLMHALFNLLSIVATLAWPELMK